MSTVLFVNIIAVLAAYLARYNEFRFGLKVSFFVIFIFLGIRYDYGNDYMGYLNDFLEFNSFSNVDFFNTALYHYEPGWLVLCRIFRGAGFFAMTFFLAITNCVIYYYFIKKFVPRDFYWVAVFLYVFTPELMLVQLSAMRQTVAITIFIFSIQFIIQKAPLKYVLCIALAAMFHSSAWALLPLYFLTFANKKISDKAILISLGVYVFLFFSLKYISPLVNGLINTYFTRYEGYQEVSSIGSGLGIIYMSIFFVLLLSYERFQTKEISLIFKIAIISFVVIPFSIPFQMIVRFGMYFNVAALVAYPVILKGIKKTGYRFVFLLLILFITLYSFFYFFQADIWETHFGKYQTIFTAPQIY